MYTDSLAATHFKDQQLFEILSCIQNILNLYNMHVASYLSI